MKGRFDRLGIRFICIALVTLGIIVLQSHLAISKGDLSMAAYRSFLPLVQGIEPAPTATPTPIPSPTPCYSSDQGLVNPSFETGMAPWAQSGYPERTDMIASDGSYSVWLGGYNNAEDMIAQAVQVPHWAETAQLTFDWAMFSDDSTQTANDVLLAVIFDPNLDEIIWTGIDNTAPRSAWYRTTLTAVDVRAFRGQTLTVALAGYTDESLVTAWFFDYVRLYFNCGGSVPPAGETVLMQELSLNGAKDRTPTDPEREIPPSLLEAIEEYKVQWGLDARQ